MKKWLYRGCLAAGLIAVICGAALPHVLPRVLAMSRPDVIFRGDSSRKIIYLSIDDVPSQATPAILQVLIRHGVPATFFVIGNRVHSDAQLTEVVKDGYAVGNHMRTTAKCSSLSLEHFEEDFDYTDRILHRFSNPTLFRPPSDAGTTEQMSYVSSKGYRPVLGTVFPLDHWIQRPWILRLLVRWLAVPGGILIMHDGDIRGYTTAKVLDAVIPALKESGFEFVELSSIQPNQALEPMPLLRTPSAGAEAAPSKGMAHL